MKKILSIIVLAASLTLTANAMELVKGYLFASGPNMETDYYIGQTSTDLKIDFEGAVYEYADRLGGEIPVSPPIGFLYDPTQGYLFGIDQSLGVGDGIFTFRLTNNSSRPIVVEKITVSVGVFEENRYPSPRDYADFSFVKFSLWKDNTDVGQSARYPKYFLAPFNKYVESLIEIQIPATILLPGQSVTTDFEFSGHNDTSTVTYEPLYLKNIALDGFYLY